MARRLSVALALVSVVLVTGGGLAVRQSPELPRPDLLTYVVDPKHHSARWTTTQGEADAFVSHVIPAGRLSHTAPVHELMPLEVTTSARDEKGVRHSTLTVSSPRAARCVRLYEQSHEPIAKALVDGKPVAELTRFSAETDAAIARVFLGGSKASAWVMEYCGAGTASFKVELFSPAGKTVHLRLAEVTDGLPEGALAPRTSSDGYPDVESDITMSIRDVSLE